MRKSRIVSLCLAVILLFSMIPTTALANTQEPQFKVSLTLSDSIAINFKIDSEDLAAESFDRVEFYNGETLLQTVTQLPAADDNGMYVFSYENIDPDMMDYKVTAKLCAGELSLEDECSVSDYCVSILRGADIYGEELSVLAMELLDYGAAAQKYIAQKRGTTVNDADLVNYGIAEAYPEIAALCKNDVTYESILDFSNEVDEAQVDWIYAGLYLQDTIVLRYGFEAESVDGLTMQATCGDNKWTVSEFKSAGDGSWDAYFDGLNPAQMRDDVVVTMYKDGQPVSNSMTYSVESYIARMVEKSDDQTLKTMLLEMLRYGDAAANWVSVCTDTDPAMNWETLETIDFETGTLEENLITNVNDTTNYFALAEDVAYNSSKSLQIDNGGRAKYSRANYTLEEGWYCISGYVKLNGADSNKISITSWRMEEGATRVATAYSFNNAVVGEADENGWSYFEIYTEQKANMPTFQFTLNNNNGSGKTVYFDNIVYEKYSGEISSEIEPEVTEPEATEPENSDWNKLAVLDFESDVTLTQKQGTHEVIGDSTRENSAKVLRVDKNSRVQYSVSATLPKGYYRLSGYVNLGNADSTKVSISIWAYQNSTGTNPVTPTMADSIVEQPDENGWSYFEMDFDHGANYTLIQFILNNYDTANSILFDDVVYAQYTGEGVPPSTEPEETVPEETVPEETEPEETEPEETVPEETEPETIWEDMIEILDFEQGVLEPMLAHTGTPQVQLHSSSQTDGQSLRMEAAEYVKYSKAETLPAGAYQLSGYAKLEEAADPANISFTIWAYTGTSQGNAKVVALSDHIDGEADENGWYYFQIDFEHLAQYSLIQYVIKNNSTGTVYFDELAYSQDPAGEENILSKLDFEGTDFPMVVYNNNPIGDFGDVGYVRDYVLSLNTGDRASYAQQKLSQSASESYKLTGWFKKENPNTAVTVSYWYRLSTSANEAKAVTLAGDYILKSTANGWNYFEIPITHNANTDFVQFIVNNTASTGANGGYVYFDDLRYMRAYNESDYLVDQWGQKLENEQAESMMVPNVLDDPYQEVETIGANLVVNGDFSAETDLLLMDKEVKANATGWTTVDSANYDTFSKITPEGTFYCEAPVGYNDNSLYNRFVPHINQTIGNIVPGATYQLKFRYKIEASNNANHSWYGPYVLLSSGSEKITMAADKATSGLDTSGQWQWFTQTMTMFEQANYVQFNLCIWLYEGDCCEIDDVEFALVSYGDQIDLDVQTKFFYTDMNTTQFTADLNEDNYSSIAQDADATVKFEVFDGKTLVWNSQAMKLTGEGYTAQTEFDLANLTVLGAPYVLKATLYDGSGEELFATSERIYIYDRPASLDINGNFVKQTPNGEKLDFNIAYAITKSDYEKVKEIGSNVMSLSNARSAEQVLGLLDYCYEHGFMGMLNMNWGLYNTDSIDNKRWVLIDVASDERIRNHPAMLGYCLADEPWSWGDESHVAENLEEGYRLIREYDKENIIFSVNNMSEFHEVNAMYNDVMLIDHYESPTNGTIYNKVRAAVDAAAGRMPVWAVLGAYKQTNYYPTGMQVRNEIWQAFLAGAKGLGYYAISYSDFDADGKPVSIWNVTDAKGNSIGQETWEGMASFKEKEWDIAYDRFADGKGRLFNEKIDINNGYMYSTWVDENGELYMVVLNLSTSSKWISVPTTSDNGRVSIGSFTTTVINGGSPSSSTIAKRFYVQLGANQVVLYKITPNSNVDFSLLDEA